MDARIELDDWRIKEALARLNVQSSGKLLPAFREIGQILKSSAQLNFRAQRGPDNIPWKKVKRGGEALRKTGRLRNSIDYNAEALSVEVGTNVIYAKVHQFGLDDPAQKVGAHKRLVRKAFGRDLRFPVYATVRPFTRHMRIWARPFLGFSEDDKADILDVLRKHLERLGTGGG